MEAGKVFLHFVVVSRLGKGGMGDVYLAEDQKLGRKVALKFLPQEFVQHEDRLRRFAQEARAASALNHPNILTIFEIGEAEGHHFIASEFIEGETLRDRIARDGALPIQQAIDIAVQIATALTAAHSAKITHRDLKPENVMIRKDGYVKVLDFGLAKQQQSTNGADQGSVFQTKTFAQTEPGTVLGTFPYMSPEQARGLDLDSRTDLFSMGIVLYEMIAGRNPFDRATRSDVIASILQQEPVQLSTFVTEVRPELEWIVNKALRKDREERYQTAREMMGDLKRLQNSGAAHSTTTSTAPRVSGPVAPTVSSAEYVVREIKKRKLAAIAAILALVAGIFVWRNFRTPESAPVQKQGIRISRLTTSGTVGEAAISPDGKLVVYSAASSGQEGLWLKQIATGSNISIVPPENILYHGLTFSPDGNFIFAARNDPRTQATSLYKVPVLGGSASKLLDHVDSLPSISPDGKRIAFVRYESDNSSKLLTAGIDGSSIRTELELRSSEFVDGDSFLWSGDGTQIIFSGGKGDNLPSLFSTILGSGKKEAVSDVWGDLDGIAWSKEQNVLLASAAHSSTNWFYQIWSIPISGGDPQRVTNDPNNYVGLSGSADSKSFVTVQNDRLSDIWIVPADGKSPAKQVTFERYDGRTGLGWTPDQKILFGNRNFDLWLMDADGGNRKMLTLDEHSNRNPSISQDGKFVAFESWRKSPRGQTCGLWIMTIEGTNPTWLAPTRCYVHATSVGDFLLFDYSQQRGIWKISRNGGEPVQLINEEVYRPVLSPDGGKIACFRINRPVSEAPEIAIYAVTGGSPLQTLPTVPGFDGRILRWTPDGKGIVFINTEAGVSNLWIQSLDGAAPKQITHFDSDQILSFDWAKDGRIAIARGKAQNDVMLIQID
jgi:eukaryotic-like serine/threonine-protein kinase